MTQLTLLPPPRTPADPRHLARELCVICQQPVMWVIVRNHLHLVDLYEWLPRSQCQSCLHTRRAHPHSHVSCGRCGDTGMVGTDRPRIRMLAIDVAWSDEEPDGQPHVRIIGPRTDRRKGEALHPFHACQAFIINHQQQEAA